MQRRNFLKTISAALVSILSFRKSAQAVEAVKTVSKTSLGIPDPWNQPRTRVYDKDLIRYCQLDVEATMKILSRVNEFDTSNREYWVQYSAQQEIADRILNEMRAQLVKDGYKNIGDGIWERKIDYGTEFEELYCTPPNDPMDL